MDEVNESEAIGWDSIDTAIKPIYGDQEPYHYGTVIKYMLGGKDPLDGLSVYKSEYPIPHWHYITFGFTELYDKESDDQEYNGYGFELTFRLIKEDETEPPKWPLNFLQNLARYVFETGNVFEIGHHLNCNGPIALEKETELEAIVFAEDPELKRIICPHGKADFIQVVGLTSDEEFAIKRWDSKGIISILDKVTPFLITDLNRKSIVSNPDIARQIENESEREGSSTFILYVSNLDWEIKKSFFKKDLINIKIGAGQATDLKHIISGRIFHGNDFFIQGSLKGIALRHSDNCKWDTDKENLNIYITKKATKELVQELEPKVKKFLLNSLPNIIFEIVTTEIKDQKGNVVKTIGN